jgi:hypothetical protein
MFRKSILVAVFLGLTSNVFLWSLKLPYGAGLDETTHVAVAAFIYEKGKLPVFGKDESATINHLVRYDFIQDKLTIAPNVVYSSMPYVGYIFSALCMKVLSQLSPKYVGWYARIPSILAYVVFIIAVYLISCRIFEEKNPLRYLVPWCCVNIPEVVFIASYTNNDMVSLAIGALVIYSWFRLGDSHQGDLPGYIPYGASLGFLGFAKLNYYILFPFTLIVYVNEVWKRNKSFRSKIIWLGKVAGLALIICGWVWLRNLLLYGDPFGASPFISKFREIRNEVTGYGLGIPFLTFYKKYILFWYLSSLETGLAKFDWTLLSISPEATCALAVLTIVSLFYFYRFVRVNFEKINERLVIYVCFILLVPSSMFLSLCNSYYIALQPEGRYLYPALIPIVVIFCTGLVCFFKNFRNKVVMSFLMGSVMFTLNIYCLNGIIIPTYENNPWYNHIRQLGKAWDYKVYKPDYTK